MLGLFKSSRCKTGTHKNGSHCIKNNYIKSVSKTKNPKVCSLDGKHYCGSDKPLKPIVARAGGKSQLANKIIAKMKPHDTYVEPFVGGGAVFLKKAKAKKNVINDKDKDVMKVYKKFKDGQGFSKCDMTPSKAKFDRVKKKSNKSTCDVAYLNKLSFGAGGTHFGGKKKYRTKRKDVGITYQNNHKEDYKEKLKNTSVTAQDFASVMKKNDSTKTVHFLDPPYYKSDGMYKERGVTPKQVCDVAKKMKGQVIITYNDHPEVRKACSGLKKQKISSRYTLGATSNNKASKELLITN